MKNKKNVNGYPQINDHYIFWMFFRIHFQFEEYFSLCMNCKYSDVWQETRTVPHFHGIYVCVWTNKKKIITKYELFTQILTALSMAEDRQQKKK